MKTPPSRFERLRFWLAVWTTPLVVQTLVLVCETFLSDFPHNLLDVGRLGKFLGTFWLFLVFNYLIIWGIGLPMLALLAWRGRRNGVFVTGAAMLCGAVLGGAFGLLISINEPRKPFVWPLLGIGLVMGAIQGAALSVVAGFPFIDRFQTPAVGADSRLEASMGQRIFVASVFALAVVLFVAVTIASFLIPSAQ